MISEISWRKFIRRVGSDNCVNDNFPGTFADFRLKTFTQEKISSYGDPCYCCEKTLNIAVIK